jgi:myo-inositol 2-dehydrogenase/D-chiro-inositol 1-dehydrogenase
MPSAPPPPSSAAHAAPRKNAINGASSHATARARIAALSPHSDNPEPPIEYLKVSGGIFHDMLCHDFDMLHFLTGEFPESVYSVGHCYNPVIGAMGDCDTAVVTLKYKSGLIATVDTSRIACYGYDQRIEVLGELGMAQVRVAAAPRAHALASRARAPPASPERPSLMRVSRPATLVLQANNVHESTVTVATAKGFLGAKAEHSFPERYAATYLTEIDEFIEQVKAGKPDPVEWTSRHVILEKVTTASELSWRLGREVRIEDVDGLRDKVPASTLHGPIKPKVSDAVKVDAQPEAAMVQQEAIPESAQVLVASF